MYKEKLNKFQKSEIIVVEDNIDDLKYLSEILKKANYKVRPATDGELALRSIKAKKPDIILLDLNLPGIDGIEVCRQIKADPETIEIPVIFISALGKSELKLKAFDAGAVDYITKPFETTEILARIITHLNIYLLQQKLKESEEKFKALYDNAPLSYQSLNEDGSFRDINPTWLSTLGYKREEVIGKYYADFLHPDWKSHFEKNFPAFIKRGYVNDVQFKIRHKDGHYLDISFEGCIGYYPDGSFKQTYCVFQDITERKKAEEKVMAANQQLKATEQQLRAANQQLITNEHKLIKEKKFSESIVATANALIVGLDKDHKIRIFNQGAENITGYTKAEVIGKDWFKIFFPKEILNQMNKIWKDAWGIKSHSYENPILSKAGKEIIVSWQTTGMYESEYVSEHLLISVGEDITERKQAEAKLIESTKRYKAFISVSNAGAWEYNTDTDFLWCSPEYFSMLGRDRDQFNQSGSSNLNEAWIDLLHPEDRERASTHFADYLKNGSVGMYENYFRMQHSDGHWIWILSRGSTIRDENGNITNLTVGTHINITAQKQAEEEIKKLNQELEQRVKERTKELEKTTIDLEAKNAELNRYNNLFIGREFRIKELRDKVADLELKLQTKGGNK